MSRENLPHKRYGVDTSQMPDYMEPFIGYRAWHWNENGITSLNNVPWTPKVAFVATCPHYERADAIAEREQWQQGLPIVGAPVEEHPVPNENCTCGLYSGLNMEHLQNDTDYIHRGIHGEVSLWGRVYAHTLGWRAQYGYPKYFVVPPTMLPFTVAEIQKRLCSLIEYNCDIYLQKDKVPSRDGVKVPLWVKDYGYSQQGISFLIDQAQSRQSESAKIRNLAVDDRVCVLGDKGGIGIVKKIEDKEFYYTLFNPNIIYRKRIRDVKWVDGNWRWETTGLGVSTRL